MTQQLPEFIEWRARDLATRVNSQRLTAVQVTLCTQPSEWQQRFERRRQQQQGLLQPAVSPAN